jgi:pentose-5-phosphate-3-epimerase
MLSCYYIKFILSDYAGLAINPPTAMSSTEKFLKLIDLLLVMTVILVMVGNHLLAKPFPKYYRHTSGEKYKIYLIKLSGWRNKF